MSGIVTQQHFTGHILFFLTLEATPKPHHVRYGEIDGAFVSCWVHEPTPALAEQVARAAIDLAGWDTLDLDECRLVTREEYVENAEALEQFEQASIDGLVFTFHTWPIGGDGD